jgi:hypothetical protein
MWPTTLLSLCREHTEPVSSIEVHGQLYQDTFVTSEPDDDLE